MAVISVDDYTTHSQHVIFPSVINERIEHLLKAPLGLPDEAYELSEDEEAELAALTAFRDEVVRVAGKLFDEATIVPEDEFEDYVRSWAGEFADSEFLDAYVDWARFAADLRINEYTYSRLYFGDDLVFVR